MSSRKEASVSLLGDAEKASAQNAAAWGTVNITEGSRTPWGEADSVSRPAPGIVFAGTPGHGGYKLSPERNAEIPSALRNRSGWYEEDCEAYIVGMVHPDAFPNWDPRKSAESGEDYGSMTREQAVADYAESKVIDWFPDQYEKATGKIVTAAMSYERANQAAAADLAAFRAEHAEEFVTTNGDKFAAWIPKGYTSMWAVKASTGEERRFLVSLDEATRDHRYRQDLVIDPHRHLDVTDVDAAVPDGPSPYDTDTGPKLYGDNIGINYLGMTPAQEQRAFAELNKRWRFPEERAENGAPVSYVTETLAERFSRVGLTGKSMASNGNGKTDYFVRYGGGSVQEVSKATWDAISGAPDSTSPTTRTWIATERAQQKVERARKAAISNPSSDPGRRKIATAEDELKAAHAEHKRISDVETERARAWQARRDEVQRAAFAALLDAHGIDLA